MARHVSLAIGKILRIHAELVDLRPDFTILDTDDQIRLLKQLIQAENIDEKRWPARQWRFSLTAGKTVAGCRKMCRKAKPVFCQWLGR